MKLVSEWEGMGKNIWNIKDKNFGWVCQGGCPPVRAAPGFIRNSSANAYMKYEIDIFIFMVGPRSAVAVLRKMDAFVGMNSETSPIEEHDA